MSLMNTSRILERFSAKTLDLISASFCGVRMSNGAPLLILSMAESLHRFDTNKIL